MLDVLDQWEKLVGLELGQDADSPAVDLDLDGLVGGAGADLVDESQSRGNVVVDYEIGRASCRERV